jgi:hypothetical protein
MNNEKKTQSAVDDIEKGYVLNPHPCELMSIKDTMKAKRPIDILQRSSAFSRFEPPNSTIGSIHDITVGATRKEIEVL